MLLGLLPKIPALTWSNLQRADFCDQLTFGPTSLEDLCERWSVHCKQSLSIQELLFSSMLLLLDSSSNNTELSQPMAGHLELFRGVLFPRKTQGTKFSGMPCLVLGHTIWPTSRVGTRAWTDFLSLSESSIVTVAAAAAEVSWLRLWKTMEEPWLLLSGLCPPGLQHKTWQPLSRREDWS